MFKKRMRITRPAKFPSGTVVKAPSGTFLVKGDMLLKVYNDRVLKSWKFDRIIEVSDEAIKNYMVGGKLGFRDGTVLLGFGSKSIYLVSDQKVRHITSPDVFPMLNISYKDLLEVSDEEIAIHKVGEPIGII